MNSYYLTREQVRDVDRRAIQRLGMSGLVLMENAGRGCVDVLCRLGIDGPVWIACGKGNNGGDGFVIARHLQLRGYNPVVALFADPSELTGDAAANYQILSKCEVPITVCGRTCNHDAWQTEAARANWIVDSLLGTGTVGAPRAPLDEVISILNLMSSKKMAIDLPSGLDCDSGKPGKPTFRADHTCTFVAQKIGFQNPAARSVLGTVHVLDIGVPNSLWHDMVDIA